MADRFRKITIPALLGTVMAYQVVGTLIEWVLVGDFYLAAQDFRIGIPGMLLSFWRLCIAESYCKKMSCKHLMLMLQTVKQPENGGAGYVLVVVMDGEHDK